MSDLIIKGMDMSKDCAGCDLSIYYDGYCGGYGYNPSGWRCRRLKRLIKEGESKPADCPLAEIPTPHGRLIDADRLIAVIKSAAGTADTNVPLSAVLASIENAPTVIEREEV